MTFKLVEPEVALAGVIVASPHSGRDYPKDLLSRTVLSAQAIRSSEDAYVDLLVADASQLGVPVLLAEIPRAYIDLNRSADELDPALVEGVRRIVHNPRVTSGLGVIPRVVANGKAIYRGKLTRKEARTRIETYWHPYHAALKAILRQQVEEFGRSVLIDCHSMPHEAIEEYAKRSSETPDVVLGDRFGAAADSEIVGRIEAAFQSEGLKVARNAPFAGAFVTQQYGRPSQKQHVVQIELDRSLYMDEAKIEPLPQFDEVRQMMMRVIAEVIGTSRSQMPVAAE